MADQQSTQEFLFSAESTCLTTLKISASTPCDRALTIWLEQHMTYIRGGTPRTYRQYVKTLSEFFQKLPLGKIEIGNVRAYQEWRGQTCCATRVNAEVSNLQMCMKEVDLWDKRIAPLYRPLRVPKTKVRQNMSEEEERRLLAVAFEKPRRRLAGHCLVLMANTSMGFGELRHVRRQDVFLADDPPFIEVNGGTKNDYRIRSIPLNFHALRSMRWIVKRWEDLGGADGEQYILPHHARRSEQERARPGHKPISPPLFSEPMGHIYRAARAILKEAGLAHLDPYDMRSHAITKLLKNPLVSDQVYTEIVGHVGNAMKRRYSKQRMEDKRAALDAIVIAPDGSDTTPPNPMHLAIQAEIARQIALAQQERPIEASQPVKSGPRLVVFPGGRSANV